jgi:excinuclease ABC subunit A
MEKLIINDAHENNLKHLDIEIPLNKFTCVTGCSGCGKSSLVFDTIYAESQRAFLEGMTGNIYGQKLMNKPQVGSIENLRPALNVSQSYYNVNPRSTIGTTTEISYYLRSLFAIVNSDQSLSVSEKIFSSNNPKSCCPHCAGLGVETVVSESLLVPDHNVTLRDGAILFFKGPAESKEQKYLEAFCEYYGIDINKKFSQLSSHQIQQLLYADDKIRHKLAYKEGKRKKQHYVTLRGAVPVILEKVASVDPSAQSAVYAKYLEETPCHVCRGTKLCKEALDYKVKGVNYGDVESMELTSLYLWIKNLKIEHIDLSKKKLIDQLTDSILRKLEALIQLGVGYLCLGRSIPTLSGGERQRVRIATQLTCSLKGLIYILDEPCKGLHYRDITKITKATQALVQCGNTVIAIEHNKQYIGAADNIVELGPVGGPDGGYLISQSNMPKNAEYQLLFKQAFDAPSYIEIKNINFRNICGQNARFPVGGITCITGVSGSGKSTLAAVISRCLSRKSDKTLGVVQGNVDIRRVIQVNQSPIGKTPRSTIASYLEIFDEIRTLFSKTDAAKKLKIGASLFSMNIKGGRCECCQGTGLQKIELNYLPSSYITCPECGGKRFNDQILSVKYCDKTIQDVLETPIVDIIDIFKETKKTYPALDSMIKLGLGYLKLGQMSMNLSGGEAQRVKLAKALSSSSYGKNLYILDEPTSGLNDKDIDKFVQVLASLQQNKETVVIIEHNVEFISKVADYIIDFGILGGELGGKIVAQGQPKSVFSDMASSLYSISQTSR